MSSVQPMVLTRLVDSLKSRGLLLRGGFHPEPEDSAPDGCRTLVLIGNAGKDMWTAFSNDVLEETITLDAWTRAQLGPLAKEVDAQVHYYFEGPPYWPFLRWAQRAQGLRSSPLGMLIDPEYGLWHAYRAAFAFSEKLSLPDESEVTDICGQCIDKPCLTACPVEAFSGTSYDVSACASYLRSEAGAECMLRGCKARRACPVGAARRYSPEHAEFHMHAFLGARDGP